MKLCRFRGRERQMEEGSFDRLNMQQCDASGVRVWWWGEISKEWRRRIKWAVGVRGVNVRPFWFCVCVVGELKKKKKRRTPCVLRELWFDYFNFIKKIFFVNSKLLGDRSFLLLLVSFQFRFAIGNIIGEVAYLYHTVSTCWKFLLYYKFKIS